MSKLVMKNRSRDWRRACPVLAIAVATLLAGCTQRHSIIVGSIPDDYRTNHPIVISEGEKVIDLPVGASSYGMTHMHKTALAGFLRDYDRRNGSYVAILVPAGSANEAAALRASGEFASFVHSKGVPREHILVQQYQSPSPDVAAPIRVAYTVMKASTGPCGRWPEDMLETTENKHYANFGCAYQNNLAAQIANPMDLLGPRKMTEIDAENRGGAIGDYKARTISDDFQGGSEVEY